MCNTNLHLFSGSAKTCPFRTRGRKIDMICFENQGDDDKGRNQLIFSQTGKLELVKNKSKYIQYFFILIK